MKNRFALLLECPLPYRGVATCALFRSERGGGTGLVRPLAFPSDVLEKIGAGKHPGTCLSFMSFDDVELSSAQLALIAHSGSVINLMWTLPASGLGAGFSV
jgi:hypothetical protein